MTDTYDVDSNILYEAKSSCDRATIRLAVGQLLDYLRFLPEARGVVLLPDEPGYDLQALLASCGLGLTYPAGSEWVEVLPPVAENWDGEDASDHAMPATDKNSDSPAGRKRSLHHRIYPYMTELVQYATESEPAPWIVRDRSAALRNERQGRGQALVRTWRPTNWTPVSRSIGD